ncbi:hypothetical protein SLEP1_g8567 [Rubroshorea leprosula]|uniref:Uncharacterized protein n=1 Tax=Rubroshorea leprosula TaxID=152421 RepID=A0AAV5IBX5_9ROSI|nr:hypothetical protein SLEP1_g8567 [Rubroshorea leprosula]
MVPCKRLLLVAFLLLWSISISISISAEARSLPVGARNEGEKDHEIVGTVKVQVTFPANEDLVTMDYPPAKNNPPIHN